MLYDIIYSGAFWRQLRKIDRADQKRILDKIESLAENPRPPGYKKLVDKGSALSPSRRQLSNYLRNF